MTQSTSSSVTPRTASAADTLLDGLFTGMIGALIVALWFLILDTIEGRPLQTPALLGSVLLGGRYAQEYSGTVAPLPVAAYTAFHFLSFAAVGIGFSYLMNLFERFPIIFFVLLVLFVCLQTGVFGLDAALGTRLIGRLAPWSVVVANLLASAGMALYQWKRHPSALQKIDSLWADDPGR